MVYNMANLQLILLRPPLSVQRLIFIGEAYLETPCSVCLLSVCCLLLACEDDICNLYCPRSMKLTSLHTVQTVRWTVQCTVQCVRKLTSQQED